MSENKRWSSGVFEVGGKVGFDIQRGAYSFPTIQFKDGEYDRVYYVAKAIPHSRVTRFPDGSWQQIASGENVAYFTEDIRPQGAPWRQDMLLAFHQWLKTSPEDISAKLKIAQSNPTTQRAKVIPADYWNLLTDPVFLGGVLDSRGNIYNRRERSRIFKISSENWALLTALGQMLGVKVHEYGIGTNHFARYLYVVREQTISDLFSFTQGHAKFFTRLRFAA